MESVDLNYVPVRQLHEIKKLSANIVDARISYNFRFMKLLTSDFVGVLFSVSFSLFPFLKKETKEYVFLTKVSFPAGNSRSVEQIICKPHCWDNVS